MMHPWKSSQEPPNLSPAMEITRAAGQRLAFFIEHGTNPADYDVVFASTDEAGNPGALNLVVREAVGALPANRWQPDSWLDPEALAKGYAWVDGPVPIVAIVTLTSRQGPASALREHLTLALRQERDRLIGKRLWVPLMGTGAGRLDLATSLQVTVAAFRELPPGEARTEVHVAISPEQPPAAVEELGRLLERTVLQVWPDPAQVSPPDGRPPEAQSSAPAAPSVKPAPSSAPPRQVPQTPPSARLHTDRWTLEDTLGYDVYATAIARFIRHDDTKPPLVISIQAPWGQGKTSLMRMVQRALDPDHPELKPQATTPQAPPRALPYMPYPEMLRNMQGQSPIPAPERLNHPTVWFNAWKYQSSDEVWAGLAHCMISQLTARLNPLEREAFWLQLQLGRIDTAAVRRDVLTATVEQAAPWLLGSALMLGSAWALGRMPGHSASPWAELGGSALSGLMAIGQWIKAKRQAFVGKVGPYVREPQYEARLGALHHVSEDIERVLGRLVAPNRPAVVFIDDLDRCVPERVAQVLEAINLFLAGSFPGCIFILGIDAEMVAAAMEVANAAVIARLGEERRHELGWRFLDKFVQLPFVIPQIPTAPTAVSAADPGTGTDTATGAAPHPFLDRLLGGRRDPVPADLEREVAELQAEMKHAAAQREPSAKQLTADAAAAKAQVLVSRLGAHPSLVQQLSAQVVELGAVQFDDHTPELRDAFATLGPHLTSNPRTLKRLVNLYRFHRFIGWARAASRPDLPLAAPAVIAHWVLVAVRWPSFVRWLQERAEDGEARQQLERIAQLARDNETPRAWSEALAGANLGAASWREDADLWRLLREEAATAPILQAGRCGLW